MHVRVKKLIGTLATVGFLIVYSFMAMLLAVKLLPGTSGVVQLGYYAVAGLAWVVPIALLISWMQRG